MRTVLELAKLMAKSFVRAKLPGRRAEQATSGFVLRLFLLAAIAYQGWNAGLVLSREPAEMVRELTCVLAGVAVLSMGFGAAYAMPSMRGVAPTLRHPFLTTLPIHEGARTVVEILALYPLYAFAALAGLHAVGGDAVLSAMVFSLGFATLGNALLRLSRCVIAPTKIAHARWWITGCLLVGYLLPMMKKLVLKASFLASTFAATHFIGRSWREGGVAVVALGLLAWAIGTAAIYAAERIGYDRLDLTPKAKVSEVSAAELDLGTVDKVLMRREPSGRGPWFMTGFCILLVAGVIFTFFRVHPKFDTEKQREIFELARGGFHAYLPFFAVTFILAQAQRAAARDAAARPLLSPLPIAPRDLLTGRVAILRRTGLSALSPIVLCCFLPLPWSLRWSVIWHTAMLLLVVYVVAETAVCVAFLSDGIATPVRTRWTLANYLLYFPVAAIGTADRWWRAAFPLAFLWLTTREARRAALSMVRWLDDDEEAPRGTSAWRALVVFGAFSTSQTWIALGLKAVSTQWRAVTILLLTYILSAALLVALTAAGRGLRGLFARPWRIERGLVFGVVSGAIAVGAGVILRRWGVDFGPRDATRGPLGVLALVLAAPVAEEIFFRGWLQSALAEREPHSVAPVVLTAALFAVVHPVESFVPVFILGLLTGYLRRRSGGVTAGILAHALHNAAAVFL